MSWYSPPLVEQFTHLAGSTVQNWATVDQANGTGGRTFVSIIAGEAASGSGTISDVYLNVNAFNSTLTWKMKVFRYNGSTYDMVGESEKFVPTNTGIYRRHLSTPISGVQAGDYLAIWLADGSQLLNTNTASGTPTLRYSTGDITGNGNTFSSSINNSSLNMEAVIDANTTGVPSIHWAGLPSPSFVASTSVGANQTLLGGNIVTQRCLSHGYITTVLADIGAVGGSGQFKFKVFRPNGTNFDFISQSEAITPAGTGVQVITLGTPMLARPGDLLGCWVGSSGTPTLRHTAGSTALLYVAGDETGSNVTFSLSGNYSPNIEAFGTNPFLCITGDSIAAGHAASSGWLSYSDGTGPSGTIAHDPGNAIRAAVDTGNPGFQYQNFGKGSQTFNWVNTTGIFQCLATQPAAIVIQCGVNDVAAARTWNQIKADLDAIAANVATAVPVPHLFLCEVLPDSNLTDAQASGTPANDNAATSVTSLNSHLATWAGSNSATVIVMHDAFGQTRVATGNLDDLLSSYDDTSHVHLNQTGQDAWAAIVEPVLLAYFAVGAPTMGRFSQCQYTAINPIGMESLRVA